mmetsp:Transcript_63862/g.160972  ORF Transcript_63862/g.160972 Transcript_63862/m.160972 type:complete len:226 (+) Transcript_63862:611-1288(+)
MPPSQPGPRRLPSRAPPAPRRAAPPSRGVLRRQLGPARAACDCGPHGAAAAQWRSGLGPKCEDGGMASTKYWRSSSSRWGAKPRWRWRWNSRALPPAASRAGGSQRRAFHRCGPCGAAQPQTGAHAHRAWPKSKTQRVRLSMEPPCKLRPWSTCGHTPGATPQVPSPREKSPRFCRTPWRMSPAPASPCRCPRACSWRSHGPLEDQVRRRGGVPGSAASARSPRL